MPPSATRRSFLTVLAAATGAGAAGRTAAGTAPPPGPRRIARLAQTPPLGWNSFDSYGVYLHEKAALANVEAMARKLKPFGYEYFVVDNGWFGEYKLVPGTLYPAEKHASDVRINEFGLLQPSRTYFPHGLQPVIDRAHELGLKFGVHLMRGIPRKAVEMNLPIQGTRHHARDIADTSSICRWCHYNYGVDMSKPGAQQFYNSLVNQLAAWGIDFIKADDLVPYPKEILGFANAIEQCGRDIVFSLSPGGPAQRKNLVYYRRANMVRITSDVWDRREDLDKGFAAWKKFQGTAYPGFWPDLDMIPFGKLLLMSPEKYAGTGSASLAGRGHTRWCELNKDQQRTFIT
ncbi:MAG: glycoside hydrolase family 27 protein, partial [Armatimonadetes bacterium]|nr:glycoside hydrolase family 27 protein [Armatimonadota bacterium]